MASRSILLGVGILLASGAVRAQSQGTELEALQTFGTAAGYTTAMGFELTGRFFNHHLGATYCPNLFQDWQEEAFGHIELPDGASLSQLQFWAYDTDPDWLTVRLYESCQAAGTEPLFRTQLATADTFGAVGTYFGFRPLDGRRVNNRDCTYTWAVIFNPYGGACKGQTLQIQKIHVSWVREVSPSPVTATFGDVPTTHPLFPYVEALAKAGVTGGCGGGNFCPDAPLKRGQMAVFLSRALGLQWP